MEILDDPWVIAVTRTLLYTLLCEGDTDPRKIVLWRLAVHHCGEELVGTPSREVVNSGDLVPVTICRNADQCHNVVLLEDAANRAIDRRCLPNIQAVGEDPIQLLRHTTLRCCSHRPVFDRLIRTSSGV